MKGVSKKIKVGMIGTLVTLMLAGQGLAQNREGDLSFDDRQPSDEVTIRSVSFAGSGCPAGSIDTEIPVGRRDEILLFLDSLTAEQGGGAPFSAKRKNCSILLSLDYPSDWTFAVQSVAFGGTVDLDSGVSAQAKASFYIQGQSATASVERTFNSVSRDFNVHEILGASQTVTAPCGVNRALVMNLQARVSGSFSRSGTITIGQDWFGSAPVALRLKWKRCH